MKGDILTIGYENLKPLTDQNFDTQIFDNNTPAMVFFGAKRCDICKELLPLVEELVGDYQDKMNVYFVDVDKYVHLHKRFSLRGIPQLLIFNNGELKNRIGGLHEKEEIIEMIDKSIGNRK